MGIHYELEQYKQIVPTAFKFWSHCRTKGLVYKNKFTGPIGNRKICLTYCPSNDTYHLYDIDRQILILFRKLTKSNVVKQTYEHLTINDTEFEWTVSHNIYKEGTSTVILMYDAQVHNVWEETEWDITELRQIMLKNFIFPLIQFNK